MSIKDKLKDAAKRIQEYQREKTEIIRKKKEILRTLRMRHLKELKEEYDIEITYSGFLRDNPTEEDYVNNLAESPISLERIKEFAEEKLKEKFHEPEPKQVTYIGKVDTGGGNFTANLFIKNIFNDFSSEVIKSNIDFVLKKEAIKKIEELQKEVSKKDKDETNIDKICKWFTKNKIELATIATPFITKILSHI